jgi:hypothetical protein
MSDRTIRNSFVYFNTKNNSAKRPEACNKSAVGGLSHCLTSLKKEASHGQCYSEAVAEIYGRLQAPMPTVAWTKRPKSEQQKAVDDAF